MANRPLPFELPRAMMVHGEGFEKMSLEKYLELQKLLAELGLETTVLPPANSYLDPKEYSNPPSKEEADSFFSQLTLVGEATVRESLGAKGLSGRGVSRVCNIIGFRGLYFPMTPRGMLSAFDSSDQHRPHFYYPSDWLTPDLLALGHGLGIDLERGVHAFSIPPSSAKTHPDYKRLATGLRTDSLVDVLSLGVFIESSDFPEVRSGTPTGNLLLEFCRKTLHPDLPQADHDPDNSTQ